MFAGSTSGPAVFIYHSRFVSGLISQTHPLLSETATHLSDLAFRGFLCDLSAPSLAPFAEKAFEGSAPINGNYPPQQHRERRVRITSFSRRNPAYAARDDSTLFLSRNRAYADSSKISRRTERITPSARPTRRKNPAAAAEILIPVPRQTASSRTVPRAPRPPCGRSRPATIPAPTPAGSPPP
jgi:hypothetical protein